MGTAPAQSGDANPAQSALRRCLFLRANPLPQETARDKLGWNKNRPPRTVARFNPKCTPGYITWDDYEENLRKLKENSRAHLIQLKAPPSEGPALLQGLALCGVRGRRMGIRYHWRQNVLIPDYMGP
jgi:hypothetical protein